MLIYCISEGVLPSRVSRLTKPHYRTSADEVVVEDPARSGVDEPSKPESGELVNGYSHWTCIARGLRPEHSPHVAVEGS